MEQRRKYQLTQPHDSLTTSPFFIDSVPTYKDRQLYGNEHVQSSVDDRFHPIFIDLAAARRKERSSREEHARYSTNVDRSNFDEEEQFIAGDKRKSLETTMRNKRIIQPVRRRRSSRSCPCHRRHHRSNEPSQSCYCCFCCYDQTHNESAADQHDSNDNCCQCDNCCECGDCDNCCKCESCGDCDNCCECGSCGDCSNCCECGSCGDCDNCCECGSCGDCDIGCDGDCLGACLGGCCLLCFLPCSD